MGDLLARDLMDLAREAAGLMGEPSNLWPVGYDRWRDPRGMLYRSEAVEEPGIVRVSYFPVLDDPATLGCLLALVREAWGDPHLVAIYCEAAHPGQSEGWGVQTADNRLPIDGVGDHPTEAHALVAALRAAGYDSGHDASKGAP